jgi:serine/threonine-protein kinase HipA
MADVHAGARSAGLKRGRADALLEEVRAAVARWRDFAARAKLDDDVSEKIQRAHRLDLR